jgi:hypothetical protein
VVLALVPIGILIVGLYAFSTTHTAHVWGEAITRWAIGLSPFGSIVGRPVADMIVGLADWISNRMAAIYNAHLFHVVNWFGALGDFLKHFAAASLSPPLEALIFARWLLEKEIPHLIHSLPSSVAKLVHGTVKIVHDQTKNITYPTKIVHQLGKTINRIEHLTKAQAIAAVTAAFPGIRLALPELRWLREHWRAITKAAAYAGGVAVPWVAVPELWKWLHAHRLRISRLEKLLTTAGFALAISRVLGLGTNWRCLTRGNIGRAARFFCGAPSWFVDFLLLGTIEAFIVTDLCGFTDLLMKEAELVRPVLLELVDVEDALIGCHGTVKPIAFNLPALSLPPMPGPSALAA